jgi:hypothetical protein
MKLITYNVFFRQFGIKGKITNMIITASNPEEAEKALKAMRPKASIVAVFELEVA